MDSGVPQHRPRRRRLIVAGAAVAALVAASPLLTRIGDDAPREPDPRAGNDGCGSGPSGEVLRVRAVGGLSGEEATAWIAPRPGDMRIEQGGAPIVRCGESFTGDEPLLLRAVRASEAGSTTVAGPGPAVTLREEAGGGGGRQIVVMRGGRPILTLAVAERISADEARRRRLFEGGATDPGPPGSEG